MRARSPALLTSFGIIAVAVSLTPACDRPNPSFHPGVDLGGDAAAGDQGGAGTQGAGGQVASGSAGATGGGGTSPLPDGGTDGAGLGACTQAGECLTAHGAPPCGAWTCTAGQCGVSCPACVDNDQDGFGVGAGCAGPDCDDTNPLIGRSGSRACYDGKGGTLGVGACHAGAQVCSEGVWSSCAGEVLPTGEACNGVDDDCDGKADNGLGTITCGLGACQQTVAACANGMLGVCEASAPAALTDGCDGTDNNCNGAVDEDCAADCVRVSPSGDDGAGTGSAFRPFRTIQAAIAFAAGAATRPKTVCVAGGDSCFASATYAAPDGNPLTMANGVSVYGNYEATAWTRCPFGTTDLPNLTVTISPRAAAGVTFPATVTTPTTLDGVRVTRLGGDSGGGGGAATTATAISIVGATKVVISNVLIDDAPSVGTSIGVSLTAGAQALITRSAIFGGGGTGTATGIRSVGSTPTIRENCATIDPTSGHCTGPCTSTSLGIHGRYAQQGNGGGGQMDAATDAVAIELTDSPGADVERNAICGAEAMDGTGVRIGGASAGTVVRGNTISGQGSRGQAFGVSLLACADATPWIVDNELISADVPGAATRAAGVNVVGACHPVIEGNTKIATGGTGGAPASAFGVFCGGDTTSVSRCTVIDNALVAGSPTTRADQSFGISCEAGACAHVAGNTVLGQQGATVVGLSLQSTGALVERNVVTGGCGTKTTTGILTDDAFSRIENNVVRGAQCAGVDTMTPETAGVRVHVAAGGNEVDVNSNTIDAGGAGNCTAAGASLGLTTSPSPKAPRGIFRDNILRAGACGLSRDDFLETSAGTTPRLFEHNDLDPAGPPSALYFTGDATALTAATAINALPGAGGNISADPMFVSATDLHLAAGSACINAGTTVGAPRTDFDGKPRSDGAPDIGAFEH